MTIVSKLILVVFLIWGGISIICQFKNNFLKFLRNWDFFGLIPIWTFFAPNPISSDTFLYYRDHSSDSISDWKRAFISHYNPRTYIFWNPIRREEKAIKDSMFQLLSLADTYDQERLHLTISYLTILNFVTSSNHDDTAIATQFLFATRKFDEYTKPIFVSNVHAINQIT